MFLISEESVEFALDFTAELIIFIIFSIVDSIICSLAKFVRNDQHCQIIRDAIFLICNIVNILIIVLGAYIMAVISFDISFGLVIVLIGVVGEIYFLRKVFSKKDMEITDYL